MSPNYIFGYGSLIENESRERTTPSARDAFPAEAQNIQRGWFARGSTSGMTTTYLGAVSAPGQTINGVIYAVSETELAATDARETAGYERKEIPQASIQMLDGRSEPPQGKIWIYLNVFSDDNPLDQNLPTPQFPMVQSYVDICVHGCLEVEGTYPTAAGFAQRFMETTSEWSRYWVNDRLYPRRPFIFQPAASSIDGVLKAAPQTAELYYEIEIEPARWEQRTPVRPTGEPAPGPPPADAALACWESGG